MSFGFNMVCVCVYVYIYISYVRNFCQELIFVGKQTHENLYPRRISNRNYGGLLTHENFLENLTHKIL